ncbi:AraC family transcriptional regulator [Metabacillus arenae]|uniref:AraC family transcriptional regulator n=1 Tax=Metabacillus arenae TaxID=2771434 RepID=A0A926NDS4_9BACI|nr:AraC family transcriptional regulator [Metabacillus arenae]MBD1379644.1 AraC family transcriptional regulator [Metabacillus arenae]
MNNISLYESELLTNHYHPKVFAYYFKKWESYDMAFHTHNEVEIMYVIDGKCIVDTEEESVSMKKGDFILLDSNVSHRLIVEKNTPCRILNVEFSFIKKERRFPSIKELAAENKNLAELLLLNRPYVVLKDPNEIYHTLKNLVLEMDKKESEQEIMIQLLLAQLLIQIARMVVEESGKKSEQQQANVYVKKTIEYLHHNYDCDIQVKDIGQAVNLHPGYLHRIFKKQTGSTIMEYLTSLRMEKAKMLLADTDIPVIEISYYIGINSRQYFSLLFKKYTNKTPIEYRKSVEQNIVKFGR